MQNSLCPYCGSPVELKDSEIIYKKSYGMVWICSKYPKCETFVGTHKADGKTPLGTLANKPLRELRKKCHNEYFDPIWKNKEMSRDDAYKLMQRLMDLPADKAHIGMFNIDQCTQLIKKLTEWKFSK